MTNRFDRFRYWLFKQNQKLAYWICPPDHRRYLTIMWRAKMDDYRRAIELAKQEDVCK